jgi:regulator of protease activity HflC (stomatin/prohibitin superfamily)
MVVDLVMAVVAAGGLWAAGGLRVVKQYERGVVFRFGRVFGEVRGPGLTRLWPGVDRMRKVNMQIVTMPVPAQDGITRDNVTVRVDAVVYFRVTDPVRAVVDVQDYLAAVGQVAQTSLRSIIGKSDLDDLLSNRERLNEGLELLIDSPALGWGVHIDRVEIKDVALPESMKRSMSRQAEAERERRARVISADGELQASEKLSQAAATMSRSPAALQLRLLETVVQVAAEKNSTLVLPFPVELLRFLESATERRGAPAGVPEQRPAPSPPENRAPSLAPSAAPSPPTSQAPSPPASLAPSAAPSPPTSQAPSPPASLAPSPPTSLAPSPPESAAPMPEPRAPELQAGVQNGHPVP